MVRDPLAWITASKQRGMEVINLWHPWDVVEDQVALIAAFSSSVLINQGVLCLVQRTGNYHTFPLELNFHEYSLIKENVVSEFSVLIVAYIKKSA